MLEKVKLMAIIREVDPDCTKKAIEILAEEGFRDFEISLSDSELGMECIRQAQADYAGSGNCVCKGRAGRPLGA